VIQGYYDSVTDAFYEEDTFDTEITQFDVKSIFVDITSNDLFRYDATATPKFIRIIETPAELGDLSNVIISGVETGEVLQFNGTNWVNAEIVIPSIDTLDDIGNVDTTGAVTGSVIKYDSTANDGAGGWIIGTDDAGTTISTLGDVGDVTITSVAASQFLRRNAGNDAWINHNLVKADVGLDQVENYPIANNTDVDNAVTNKYMTPSNTKYAIDQRIDYLTTTIGTGDWSGTSPTTAVKTVSGILSTDKPLIDIDLSAVAFADVEDKQTEYAKIYRVAATDDDEITFYALEAPTEELVIQIKVVR
jgi:hypothetical protein